MSETAPSPAFLQQVEHFYQFATPDPRFLASLRSELAQAAAQPTLPSAVPLLRRSQPRLSLRRPAWAIGFVLLAVLVSAFLAVGPQRVLAEVERLLGYLPGVGFVSPDQTRMLAAPLQAKQGNSTLDVQQVVAFPDRTIVVATLRSLPDEITIGMQWVGQVTLLLPDGQRWHNRQASQYTRAGELSAVIEYPPLPAGIDQVTLEMPTLPLAANGATQEFWSLVLPLQSVGQTTPGSLAVAPYTPKDARAAKQGVTVRLLQVAPGAQETGLLLQVDWKDPTWDIGGITAELQDDLGRVYQQLAAPPGFDMPYNGTPHGVTTQQELLRFPALDPGARQVSLKVSAIRFRIFPQAQFQFDPGSAPALGQTWDFAGDRGKRLQMGGFQVQILQAALSDASGGVQVTMVSPPGTPSLPQPTPLPGPACRLEFIVQVTPRSDARLLPGALKRLNGDQAASGVSGSGDLTRLTITVDLSAIPTAPLFFQFTDATLTLQGGWQIRWGIPR
ncbi:MAG: hypothetical protein PHQ40_21200 [Anaerolineaceae bacterium]|nr:hypothetical protein [Anaerolineaceae bacterium]